MERTTFAIEGMTCGHCVAAVKNALEGLGGVNVEHVSVGSATVSYDPETTSVEQLTQAVREAGYEPIVEAGR